MVVFLIISLLSLFSLAKRILTKKLMSLCQDIAAAVDEEDVVKFTDVIKEFDSMTPLVKPSPALKL
jgi:hypothetical protein